MPPIWVALKRSIPSSFVLFAALLPTWCAALLTLACTPLRASTEPGASRPGVVEDNRAAVENGPWMNAELSSAERVRAVLAEMSVEEKLRLLMGYYGADAAWKGYTAPAEARPGSAGYVPGIARLGIPRQWQTDAGMGVATQGSAAVKRERTALPSGLAMAASWDPSVAEAGGRMIGEEAHASGFNVMLAGSVNLQRDPHCGRNFEYAGEDPYLAGVMAGAQIAGIQSQHVISTLKHYAVNAQETDRNAGDSILDPGAARMSDLLAFELALERGRPGAVMCAYNKLNGTYACENAWLLTQVLRKDWGFSGYVLSDWGAVHSSAKAANAGLEQASGFPFDDRPYFGTLLRQAVESGEVSRARLDEMAGRVLFAMFENGLFEHPPKIRAIDFEKNGALSQHAAEQGIVLLKNEEQILPLAQSVKTVAMIGGYADRGVLSGGGSSQVYPRGKNAVPDLQPSSWPGPVMYFPSSPLIELRRAAPHTQITFDPGTKQQDAVALAKRSDVAIVFVTQWTTETLDVPVVLPDDQDDLIRAVAAANPKTIVVLETGGPVLMPWAKEVGAIVQAWYPGTQGGRAIARVLSGAANPSGRLPFTIPLRRVDWRHPDLPKAGKVHYEEGATVGYKWFDQQQLTPRFEFGSGLSYTTFAYAELALKPLERTLEVTFSVENTGENAGQAVAQIYVAGKGWEAPQRLAAFAKVALEAGEKKLVSLRVDPRLLAIWNEKSGGWKIAPGSYEVRLGSSSRRVHQRGTIELEGASWSARSH